MGWRRGSLINVEVHVGSATADLITLSASPRSAGGGVKEKKQAQRSLSRCSHLIDIWLCISPRFPRQTLLLQLLCPAIPHRKH